MGNFSTGFQIYIYVVTFVFGTVFGSFCNAWAWRIVHHESIAKGRSHCAECGHELGAADLIPVLSYVMLKGRCRYCGKKISPRYLIVEIISGVFFISVIAANGLSITSLRYLVLGCILLVASLVDLDIMELPDGLMAAGAIVSLLRLVEGSTVWSLLLGLIPAAALLALVLVMDRIMKKETMGGGDIKLMAVLGLNFGIAGALFIIIAACIIGIIAAYATGKGKGKAFPFGPVLSVAAWLMMTVGEPAIAAYMSLF